MTGKGTSAEPYCFADEIPGNQDEQWSIAYAFCRELDKPIVVEVGPEVSKIFPSGYYRMLRFSGEPAIILGCK